MLMRTAAPSAPNPRRPIRGHSSYLGVSSHSSLPRTTRRRHAGPPPNGADARMRPQDRPHHSATSGSTTELMLPRPTAGHLSTNQHERRAAPAERQCPRGAGRERRTPAARTSAGLAPGAPIRRYVHGHLRRETVGSHDAFSHPGARISRCGAADQSDQCGGASTTPSAVVADTTEDCGQALSARGVGLPADGREPELSAPRALCSSELRRRHIVPQVSAPGRIRTSDLRIRRPLGLSAVLNGKFAGRS